MSYKYLNL